MHLLCDCVLINALLRVNALIVRNTGLSASVLTSALNDIGIIVNVWMVIDDLVWIVAS